MAETRPDVLERIKPVGEITVAGQAKPAAPAPAAEETAPAAEATAPAAEETTAAAPEAAAPAEPAPAAPAAAADDPATLAQTKGCLACHKVDMKVVGPAYKEVAAKYKGDAGAVDMLVAKVKAGGVGTWGQIPMPPQTLASDEEIRTLVEWILSQ
jgi:cytochrome c